MGIEVVGIVGSMNTLSVIVVLKELGLPYKLTLQEYDVIKSQDYLANMQPFGQVPVLIDDGFQLYESRAISRYLINKYQGTKNSTVLVPTDSKKAALVDQFVSVECTNFNAPITKIIMELIIKKFYGAVPDDKIVKESHEQMNNVLDVYEKLLEGKDYLTGEFSLADILHCPYIQYGIKAGHGDLFNDPKRPNVSRWWKNISGRESWKSTVAEDKLE